MRYVAHWNVLLSSYTWFHRCRQYSRGYHLMLRPRNYSVAMSCLVRPTIGQHVDRISPLKLDNCLNRSRRGHKCNYQQQPNDSSAVVCSSLGMNSKHRLMYHIVRNCSSNSHHHSRHLHKLNHQMSIFPSMSVSFPSALCIAMCLSLDCSIQPLISQLLHRICEKIPNTQREREMMTIQLKLSTKTISNAIHFIRVCPEKCFGRQLELCVSFACDVICDIPSNHVEHFP